MAENLAPLGVRFFPAWPARTKSFFRLSCQSPTALFNFPWPVQKKYSPHVPYPTDQSTPATIPKHTFGRKVGFSWALVETAQRFPRRGGRVLGVHGAGSVQGPPSPAVLMAAASASSAGLSNAPWPGCIASAASRCATNAARTSTKPFSRSAAPSSPGTT